MTDLTGKTILITGGSSGVGADMAKDYAARGATVWISGRRQDALDKVADCHKNIHAVQGDVAKEEDVVRMFKTAGTCDVVIANAGISMGKAFTKTALQEWQAMMDVNLTGVYLTFREGLRQMPENYGRVIAVASAAGLKGYPYAAAYSATKHGVIGLVRSVALEVAKTGITVNAICPGYINTEMTDKNIQAIIDKTGKTEDEAKAILTATNPQGVMIEPSDVTACGLYLMSDAASGVNGHTMAMSGGEV